MSFMDMTMALLKPNPVFGFDHGWIAAHLHVMPGWMSELDR